MSVLRGTERVWCEHAARVRERVHMGCERVVRGREMVREANDICR